MQNDFSTLCVPSASSLVQLMHRNRNVRKLLMQPRLTRTQAQLTQERMCCSETTKTTCIGTKRQLNPGTALKYNQPANLTTPQSAEKAVNAYTIRKRALLTMF